MSKVAVTQRLALALAATLALAGCGAVAAPSSVPIATSTLAPVASPERTIAPTPSSSAPGPTFSEFAWQALDLFPEADGPFDPGLVMSDANGLIVVARVHDASTVWSSADGWTWTTDVLPAVAQSTASPYTGAASWNRTVLLGVGDGQCAHPVADFTWARSAGGAWEAAPWQTIFCAGGQGSIATNGRTFVVAGTGAGDQPFLWSSSDGLTWTNTSIATEIAPVAVVWTGSEFLVLARGQSGFVALTSPDGAAWSDEPASGLPEGGVPRLFVLSERTVALLPGADRSLVAYERQANGSWQAAVTTGLQASADDVTTTSSSNGFGFVFLSTAAAGGSVLTSFDGLAWHTLPTPAATRFIGAAAIATGAVFVGANDGASGTRALAWWLPAVFSD